MPSVTVTATDKSGATASTSVAYSVSAPTSSATAIGMSSPKAEWSARVAEVGTTGLKARRIFADLADGPQSQSDLISAAVAAGQMPVVSYKTGLTATPPASMETTASSAAAYLASFNVPMAVAIWHEPMSDMSGPEFVALQNRFAPKFKGVGKLKVGPILNGFLLTQPNQSAGNGINEFATYTTPALLNLWDFFGIDSYQPGTISAPNTDVMPVDRVVILRQWLAQQGHAGMPWGIGEYNGFSAEAISGMGEALLADPNAFFGCVWNVDAARAGILVGDRLAAFKATKADARAAK